MDEYSSKRFLKESNPDGLFNANPQIYAIDWVTPGFETSLLDIISI